MRNYSDPPDKIHPQITNWLCRQLMFCVVGTELQGGKKQSVKIMTWQHALDRKTGKVQESNFQRGSEFIKIFYSGAVKYRLVFGKFWLKSYKSPGKLKLPYGWKVVAQSSFLILTMAHNYFLKNR